MFSVDFVVASMKHSNSQFFDCLTNIESNTSTVTLQQTLHATPSTWGYAIWTRQPLSNKQDLIRQNGRNNGSDDNMRHAHFVCTLWRSEHQELRHDLLNGKLFWCLLKEHRKTKRIIIIILFFASKRNIHVIYNPNETVRSRLGSWSGLLFGNAWNWNNFSILIFLSILITLLL